MPATPKTAVKYSVREICAGDLEAGVFKTLTNLTEVGKFTAQEARERLALIRGNPFHKMFVGATRDGCVLGLATLLVEPKFIHGLGFVGHVEDVVTRAGYEGHGIASAVLKVALEKAREMGCYKAILDCSTQNMRFYEGLGFREHEHGMRMDLKPAVAPRR